MSSEYESEPVRGLPEHLPAGEEILWQGAPDWRSLARQAFHVRGVAIYFALLLAWRGLDSLSGGASLLEAAVAVLWLLPVAAAGVGILLLLGWLSARTTIYTITNRRVVLRFGMALPMMLNLPFRAIAAANLKLDAKGFGDLPLTLSGRERLAYLHLWPHARPWRLAQPEPMLRAVPEAAKVAEILGHALVAAQSERDRLAPRAETATTKPTPAAAAADLMTAAE